MAFKDLPRSERGFGRETLKNTVRCFVVASGTVNMRLSADLYEKMGSPAFCKVMVGSGEHQGRIAVLPRSMKVGDVRPFRSGRTVKSPVFQVGAKRIGVMPAARRTMTLPFEITEDGLIIDIRPLMKPVAVPAVPAAA